MSTDLEKKIFFGGNIIHFLESIYFDPKKKHLNIVISPMNHQEGEKFIFENVNTFEIETLDKNSKNEFPKEIIGISNFKKGKETFFVIQCSDTGYIFKSSGLCKKL